MIGFGRLQLEPDEQTIAVAAPDQTTFWLTIGVGAVIGFCCCFIPGLVVLIYGLLQRDRFGNSECIVTDRRIIVVGWGGRNRLIELRHEEIARVSTSGSLTKSVTIFANDGRRVKLDFVESAAQFALQAQSAVEASRTDPPEGGYPL